MPLSRPSGPLRGILIGAKGASSEELGSTRFKIFVVEIDKWFLEALTAEIGPMRMIP